MSHFNCEICGEPTTLTKEDVEKYGGNPKIYHIKCAMEDTKESRNHVQKIYREN